LGNRDEPACVLGGVRDHLIEKCCATSLWHPQLGAYSQADQFALLDGIFFSGTDRGRSMQDAVADCDFLTNVSEAFDELKAFILRPPGQELVVLARRSLSSDLFRVSFPVDDFANAVNEFNRWLCSQEQRLARADA
jgi:hypothetical protein